MDWPRCRSSRWVHAFKACVMIIVEVVFRFFFMCTSNSWSALSNRLLSLWHFIFNPKSKSDCLVVKPLVTTVEHNARKFNTLIDINLFILSSRPTLFLSLSVVYINNQSDEFFELGKKWTTVSQVRLLLIAGYNKRCMY